MRQCIFAARTRANSASSLRGAKRRGNPDPHARLDCFASLAMTDGRTNQKEGKRNADRRVSNRPHHFGCGSVLSGARSPVGVPPRFCLAGFRPLRATSGQVSWDVARTPICNDPPTGGSIGRSCCGRYPPPPVPVQGRTPRTGRSAGQMMPEAARERSVSFRPRAPHSLRTSRAPSRWRPLQSEIRRMVTEMATNVNGKATKVFGWLPRTGYK